MGTESDRVKIIGERLASMFTEEDFRPRTNYDLNESLSVVKAIGKRLCPEFSIDADNRALYENLIRWCHSDPNLMAKNPFTGADIAGDPKRGIYIAGGTGTGKTMSLLVMSYYCRLYGLKLFMGTETRLLAWKSVAADEISRTYAKTGDISEYIGREILCIQDLGNESEASSYMGNRVYVTRQLICTRADRRRGYLLVTSNMKIAGDKIAAAYDDRTASRLADMCNYYELRGRDRRKQRFSPQY